MNFWLKIFITISIFCLMVFGGFYTYKFLNNKLISGNSWWEIIVYAVLLFVALGTIYVFGLLLMGWVYNYIAQ